MANDLKPCPFCGSTPLTAFTITSCGGGSDSIDFSVGCLNCRIAKTFRLKMGEKDWNFDTLNEIIEIVKADWNKRIGDTN